MYVHEYLMLGVKVRKFDEVKMFGRRIRLFTKLEEFQRKLCTYSHSARAIPNSYFILRFIRSHLALGGGIAMHTNMFWVIS